MFREELDISNTGFESEFSNFLSKKELIDQNIISSVSKIIEEVSIKGDQALIDITKKLDNHLIEDFFISETFPNPFNPQTSFNYGIPYSTYIDIKIYNSIGQIVYKSDKKYHQAGIYTFIWNPINLTSGIYYIQLKSGDMIINKKTTYIK